eukprot:2856084-Rhodomonas_salina.1
MDRYRFPSGAALLQCDAVIVMHRCVVMGGEGGSCAAMTGTEAGCVAPRRNADKLNAARGYKE